MAQREWVEIARRRIVNILRSHTVARMRTLEQKISDAGPGNQRPNPHILTIAADELLSEGTILRLMRSRGPWYHLPQTDRQKINSRLREQEPILDRLSDQDVFKRLGQTLEIAVFRSLNTGPLQFAGHYHDLDLHADNLPYLKDEPPSAFSGRAIPNNRKLDFLIASDTFGLAGVEVKNRREWIYPKQARLRDLLAKCCYLNAVPILIARRIHYSTFTVFYPCGLLIHETYNQRYPASEAELAEKAKAKTLLGYYDIRLGNQPDPRLRQFIHQVLPSILPERRRQFDRFKDLLHEYAIGDMPYEEFAGRVRRRKNGQPEDNDSSLDEGP